MVSGPGEVGGEHAGQGAAEAEPGDVDLRGAGDVGDDVERLQRPVEQVVIECHAAHGGVGVAVGDGEDRALVPDRPLDEAAPWREVHDVVLVDPRRAGQHRHGADLRRLRRVLDQLHQLIPEHHLAGGGREIPADRERARVDLAGAPAVTQQVVEEVASACRQAGSAGLKCPLERCRIGEQEVRRRERVQHEAGCQLRFRIGSGIAGPSRADSRPRAGCRPGRPAGRRRTRGCHSMRGQRTAYRPRRERAGPPATRTSGLRPPARSGPGWPRTAAWQRQGRQDAPLRASAPWPATRRSQPGPRRRIRPASASASCLGRLPPAACFQAASCRVSASARRSRRCPGRRRCTWSRARTGPLSA